MGDFFRGWRRRIGVVTLAVALVFMGGWVRSSVFHDSAGFEEAGRLNAFGSYQGRIYRMQIIANGKGRNNGLAHEMWARGKASMLNPEESQVCRKNVGSTRLSLSVKP